MAARDNRAEVKRALAFAGARVVVGVVFSPGRHRRGDTQAHHRVQRTRWGVPQEFGTAFRLACRVGPASTVEVARGCWRESTSPPSCSDYTSIAPAAFASFHPQCGKPRRVFRPDSGDSRLIRRQLRAPHLTPLRGLALLQALGQGLKARAALVWVVWVLGVGHEVMVRHSLSPVNFLPAHTPRATVLGPIKAEGLK